MATKPPAPSDLADKFMLRLPDGMRDQIAAEAEKNGRSMNSEIVQRLSESLASSRSAASPVIDQMLRILDQLNSTLASDPKVRREFEEAVKTRGK